MHHKTTKIFTVLAMLALAMGCKRESLPVQVTAPATPGTHVANKVQQWLKQQPLAPTDSKQGGNQRLPKHTVQWGQTRQQQGQYMVPLALEGNTQAGLQVALVATEDAQGQISGGQYMAVVSADKASGQDWIGQLATPGAVPASFSGAVLYYNTAGEATGSKVYKNGQLRPNASARLIHKKQTATANRPGAKAGSAGYRPPSPCNTALVCIDWYWQTFVDGVLVSEEYLYTTCECPVDGSGGGSGGGDQISACQAAFDNFVAQSKSVSNSSPIVDESPQSLDEWHKVYRWKFFDAVTWVAYSIEDAVWKKVYYPSSGHTLWEFKDFKHRSIQTEGVNIGGQRELLLTGPPSINMQKYSAHIRLDYTVKHTPTCNIPGISYIVPGLELAYVSENTFRTPNTITFLNLSRNH
jgi:hypothetical protein